MSGGGEFERVLGVAGQVLKLIAEKPGGAALIIFLLVTLDIGYFVGRLYEADILEMPVETVAHWLSPSLPAAERLRVFGTRIFGNWEYRAVMNDGRALGGEVDLAEKRDRCFAIRISGGRTWEGDKKTDNRRVIPREPWNGHGELIPSENEIHWHYEIAKGTDHSVEGFTHIDSLDKNLKGEITRMRGHFYHSMLSTKAKSGTIEFSKE